MGQKVHPYVLRLGFGKDWRSRWFTARKREFADFLEEDIRIREVVRKNYPKGSISDIIIERVSPTLIKVFIKTSRPGVIIGRRGQDIEKVKNALRELTKKEIDVPVQEVSEAALDAQLVAETIAFQLTKRVNFRRAMKKAMQQAQNLGCEGMKMRCSGRLEGAEIARAEIYRYGKVPLQTFSADIDYGFGLAATTYGTIGVKVWIYRGVKPLGAYMIQEAAPQQDRQRPRYSPRQSEGER
ncbi:MAG: 30S ribosomal protein S3 [Candidatus Omnitrophota bacterium]|nr:30S ribosomal protein S3 [Candidatus Omnitrophota bacterium]